MSNFWVYYSYDGNLSVGQGKECEHLFRVCRSKVMLFSSSNWSKCSLYLTTVKFFHLKFVLEYCHVALIYFASCYPSDRSFNGSYECRKGWQTPNWPSLPRGDVISQDFWQGQILHGSTLSMQSVQNNGWIENDLSSTLNQARSESTRPRNVWKNGRKATRNSFTGISHGLVANIIPYST